MSYAVLLEGRAQRELRTLEDSVLRRVDASLRALAANPRSRGALKLQGKEGDGWRVRVGDYRILYTIDDREQVIRVYRIKHRKEAYR